MTRTQRAIFVDFRTEIGRSQSSHFFTPLSIARRPHITQSDLVFFILACLARLSSSESLSCAQGADTSIPTCSSEKSHKPIFLNAKRFARPEPRPPGIE